jgi:formylglycine-generating enzyme required for sulfatase activity
MVVIPAGSFTMGSPSTEEGREGNEGPRHLVTFRNAFAMGQHEVTFDQYDACVADGGCTAVKEDQGWGRGLRPVINVTYFNAVAYAEWLSRKTGHRYFLPSESEWEYAARAGTDTPWNTGEAIISEDGNFVNQFGRTVPVGGFPPNAFGLYDTHGNVGEWVKDCIDIGYFSVPVDGGAMMSPANCSNRAIRGGDYDDTAAQVRSARRMAGGQAGKGFAVGFRVARAL